MTIATLAHRRPVPGPTLSAAEEQERRMALRRQAAGLAGKEND